MNFYPNTHDEPDQQRPYIQKRSTINETQSTIQFEHATNKTSPYFFNRTDNKLKRNYSNGESRSSSLLNIHSKPLINNRLPLWDESDWQTSSTEKSVITTTNLRKKG